MDKRIEEYLLGILRPQLERHPVPKDAIGAIIADIESRLRALLARWHDEEWRDTLLVIGREEGTFYEPGDASLSIRSLVVVTIRNSALEHWHVEKQYGGRGRYLDEEAMQEITEAGIRYFDTCALHTLPAPTPAEKNPFASLEQEFPYAWNAFAVLAEIHRQEDEQPEKTKEGLCFSFEPPEGVTRPPLPPVAKQMQADKKYKRGKRGGLRSTITLSGMSPEFDEGLVSYLALIRDGRMQLFYTDSWKGISRHPKKLFTVINFILAYKGFVVSPNYALASTSASIRTPLLAPAHLSTEGKAAQDALNSPLALSPWHRSLLEHVVKGLPANEKQDERHDKRAPHEQRHMPLEKTHLVEAQALGMVGDYPLLIIPRDEITMLILGTEQKRKERRYQSKWAAPELPGNPVVFLELISAEASFVISIERRIYVPFFEAALRRGCYAVGGIKGDKTDQEFWDLFELTERERAFMSPFCKESR